MPGVRALPVRGVSGAAAAALAVAVRRRVLLLGGDDAGLRDVLVLRQGPVLPLRQPRRRGGRVVRGRPLLVRGRDGGRGGAALCALVVPGGRLRRPPLPAVLLAAAGPSACH